MTNKNSFSFFFFSFLFLTLIFILIQFEVLFSYYCLYPISIKERNFKNQINRKNVQVRKYNNMFRKNKNKKN